MGSPLSNRLCRSAGVILQKGSRLTNRVTYVGGAAHFNHSASTLQSGDIRLTLNFWQRVIKERQENIIQATLSELSRQRSGSACALLNIKWFATIKEAVFSNFNLTYLTCCLHPPDIPCEEGESQEGPVHDMSFYEFA